MIKEDILVFLETRRKLVNLFLIFIAIFIIGTLGFMILKHVPLGQGLQLTFETLAFVHQLETGGVRALQLLLLIFGVILVWFTLWTSLDIVMEGHFDRYFREVGIMKQVKRLKNHYVICGAGRVGMHAAELLTKKKAPFVLIEKQDFLIRDAIKKGFPVMEGSALEESILKEAGIEKAKGLLAVLPETEKNILVILTAKELNPQLEIFARCSHEEHVKRLRQAGADHVFLPELSCAEEIVNFIHPKPSEVMESIAK